MTWTVHPHGPLEPLTPDLWRVEGTLPRSPLPRNMVVWRMPSGGLWIHSAVNLDDAGMAELEALGPPEVLVVPSRFHRADAAAWRARYPDVLVVAPAKERAAVETQLPVDSPAEEAMPNYGVECVSPAGLKPGELVYKVPLTSGGYAMIVTDILFHLTDHLPGVRGWVLRWITRSTGFFGLSGLGRVLMLQDTESFQRWLREQADAAGLRMIVVAHGAPVTHGAADKLREAAERL